MAACCNFVPGSLRHLREIYLPHSRAHKVETILSAGWMCRKQQETPCVLCEDSSGGCFNENWTICLIVLANKDRMHAHFNDPKNYFFDRPLFTAPIKFFFVFCCSVCLCVCLHVYLYVLKSVWMFEVEHKIWLVSS